MFHHVKDLQFDARVSAPDPRFAGLLLEQFGGPNGELKAAMQYFVQAFAARRPYPDKYDMLMDIATEELSHLEIVGATITMLLDGINSELKQAAGESDLMKLLSGQGTREELLQNTSVNGDFIVDSGGGPKLTNNRGVPWSGSYVNANGDLTVDLRSNIAAESRAKIVYEYLLQFTDDPEVKRSLRFLMTREIAHFQSFASALETIEPNFPPGVLQGDPEHVRTYFNLSNGQEDARGPWNEGQGPWGAGQAWRYVSDPVERLRKREQVLASAPEDPDERLDAEQRAELARTREEVQEREEALSRKRHDETRTPAERPQSWTGHAREDRRGA